MKKLGKLQSDSDVINKQPKVLLIGYGWVGQYMGKYFTEAHYVGSNGYFRRVNKGEHTFAPTLEEANNYDLAIISVPTPMNPETGQCDTSIVEEVIKKYKDIVKIFLVKSTVEIGTCKRLEQKYNVSVCMSPEYVGETLGHPLLEPRRDAFQIIGGNKIAREAVARMFMKVLHADAPIHLVSHEEAEIIKYMENYYLMRLVDYWNDVFEVCQQFKVSFNAVREGIILDSRVLRTHSNIYPDNRGWSGKCLPKDMNALAFVMRKLGNSLGLLEHLIEKNAKFWRKTYKDSNKLLPKIYQNFKSGEACDGLEWKWDNEPIKKTGKLVGVCNCECHCALKECMTEHDKTCEHCCNKFNNPDAQCPHCRNRELLGIND